MHPAPQLRSLRLGDVTRPVRGQLAREGGRPAAGPRAVSSVPLGSPRGRRAGALGSRSLVMSVTSAQGLVVGLCQKRLCSETSFTSSGDCAGLSAAASGQGRGNAGPSRLGQTRRRVRQLRRTHSQFARRPEGSLCSASASSSTPDTRGTWKKQITVSLARGIFLPHAVTV